MIDPSTLESYGYGAEKIFANLEIRIMLDVARRIHDAGVITRSADWQLYQLKLMGYSNADIRKLVESALGDSEAYVNSLYEEAIKTDYIRYKPMYEYLNKDFVPWIANTQLRNIVEQKRRNTINDYTNMTRSLGFVVKEDTGLKAVRLTDYVNDKLNQCYVDIATGAFDYNTTLRKAVTEMTNSGVRWINYDTGWHNRITVAARRAVMSSLSDINSSISDQVAKDLNTDTFEVTAHANARPTHAVWQGGWYTKRGLEEVCGLGDITGLLGANCYHNYYPVIPGLSKHTYTKKELEEWKNDTPKEYGGKSYTGYEATQRMRKMETNMRAYRERIKILKDSGGSEVDILSTQARYRAQMNEYARFSDAMGLKQQKERIYADGLGKVGTGIPSRGDKRTNNVSLNKYSMLLKGREKAIQNHDISALIDEETYINVAKEIDKKLVGLKASDDIMITGYKTHFIDRVIGEYQSSNETINKNSFAVKAEIMSEKPRQGVPIEYIKDCLQNSDKATIKPHKSGKRSKTYILKGKCAVTINPDSGDLIQTNRL